MSLNLAARLIYGCGRLAGGVSAGASADLLRQAFDGGITAVDVAPSYGLGLAEKVVGRAVRDHASVRVTTKVGIPRPHLGWTKSVARAAKRGLGSSAPRSFEGFAPLEPPARYDLADFSHPALRDSLARSHEALGRIDAVLLHNCGPEEATPELLGEFEALSAGLAAAPGYGNQARWDQATDAAFPVHFISQTAIDPVWLVGDSIPTTRERAELHSLLPTAEWLARSDPGFSARWDVAAKAVSGPMGAARIAAILALVSVRVPQATLIISSTRRERLTQMLDAVHKVGTMISPEEIAAIFTREARP
ncbi:aldo/keto reductase [Qipengyuania sphaerica]|uniref:aldo/keto reductase n=1 Tax=Qipengyuania sphaerica TaxID=2867243 RepID=UPI001C86900C|nr:aldo/keto reductase [Qipengyuania sphaerica]MBX7539507.1 aldo/keto reductase [Qipengyuania sphaerica]